MKAKVCPVAKLEKLLIATDCSEYSESAIREAINLAKICSSKLIAVTVVRTNPEFEAAVPQVIEKAEEEAREHLDSIKIRASKEGIDCEMIIHRGEEPYQDIVADALKNQVNHGHTWQNRT